MRAVKDWGTGLTKVSQLGGLGTGTNGTAGQRETRGCVHSWTLLTQQSGPFTVNVNYFLSFLPLVPI